MKPLTAVAAALLLLCAGSTLLTLGCGKQEPVPPPPTGGGGTSGARPDKLANGEPAVITVKHVLISFAGAERSDQKRTREEAQNLAYQILGRANKGEDFDKLIKEFSNDPGGGTYTLINTGLAADQGAGEYERTGMVPAFGDVGFRISLNEIALAEHDPKSSPFGWHVIKRVK